MVKHLTPMYSQIKLKNNFNTNQLPYYNLLFAVILFCWPEHLNMGGIIIFYIYNNNDYA